ncbi:hypothetical protein C8R44DRAFT_631191 [Mycena epipterygia]|nr:hypothetical protein C8R44DRAFT_631191 [Mycena epipterygia]
MTCVPLSPTSQKCKKKVDCSSPSGSRSCPWCRRGGETSPLPELYHTSVRTGQMWINELLTGHQDCICHNIGMHKHVF